MIVGLHAAGSSSVDIASHPVGLPLYYYNTRYAFTFFLPDSWRVAELKDEKYSLAEEKGMVVVYTPMITIRHPQGGLDAKISGHSNFDIPRPVGCSSSRHPLAFGFCRG
jgi:hypothetical protein